MTVLNKKILFQYFEGTASPLQRALILQWLQDDSNRELFYQWLEEWEADHVQFVPDVELQLAGMLERLNCIGKEDERHTVAMKRSKMRGLWTAKWIAASVVLILGLAITYFRGDITEIRYRTAYGEIKEFTLPDGSRVVLNANSCLTLPRWNFNRHDRQVELNGEAAFCVIHTRTNQKFVVKTHGYLNVEVLGTEFSVYSRDHNNKVELKKGAVKVFFKQPKTQPLLMQPGDVVNMNSTGRIVVKHQQPSNNFIAWKDHRFVFDSTSLGEAVQAIHEFFGDNITIPNEALRNKRITGSFRAESCSEILSALAQLFDMEITRNGETVQLDTKK
jgi:ferric-dicitrate binding protein FerR (iron transport regulator)